MTGFLTRLAARTVAGRPPTVSSEAPPVFPPSLPADGPTGADAPSAGSATRDPALPSLTTAEPEPAAPPRTGAPLAAAGVDASIGDVTIPPAPSPPAPASGPGRQDIAGGVARPATTVSPSPEPAFDIRPSAAVAPTSSDHFGPSGHLGVVATPEPVGGASTLVPAPPPTPVAVHATEDAPTTTGTTSGAVEPDGGESPPTPVTRPADAATPPREAVVPVVPETLPSVRLPPPPDPADEARPPTTPAPVEVHIGTIEIVADPAPAAVPRPVRPSRPGLEAYARLRSYDWDH
jgi:hypothetical protein